VRSRRSGYARPPSWWWIFGREDDRRWALEFIQKFRGAEELTAEELAFYLGALERLARDEYPRLKNRPKKPINFWLALYYDLSIRSGKAPKKAAGETAALAGLDKNTVQGHARQYKQSLAAYIEHSWARLPSEIRDNVSKQAFHEALIRAAAHRVFGLRSRR